MSWQGGAGECDASAPVHVVVFAQSRNFLGAVLVHMPLLWSIRRRWAGCRITVYSRCERSRLLAQAGLADEVHLYRHVTPAFVQDVRRQRPHLLINLHPSSGALHLAAALSRANTRIGFRSFSSRPFYTHLIDHDRTIYRAHLYCRAATLLGIDADPSGLLRHLAGPRADGPVATSQRICVLPGGGAGAFKRWGIPNFVALCRELRREWPESDIVFCIGSDDSDSRHALATIPLPERTRVIIDAPLAELCAEIMFSSVVIGNDCGPSHIAQIGGKLFVGLYSNHDGRLQERLDEWFLPRPEARALASAPREDIRRIPVEAVVNAVRELVPIAARACEAAPMRLNAAAATQSKH